MQVNIYLHTQNRGVKARELGYIYMLEAITSKEPVTKTYMGKGVGTYQRMSAQCLLSALKRLNKSAELVIYTDSGYVTGIINQSLNNWIADKWGKDVANKDLWQQIADELQKHMFIGCTSESTEYTQWMKRELERRMS